jgi:hypothetical protein
MEKVNKESKGMFTDSNCLQTIEKVNKESKGMLTDSITVHNQ